MNVRVRAWWRRHAALLAAAALHAGLLWLFLLFMADPPPPPPADAVEMAMVTPAPPPKHIRPKPIAKPAVRPAETNDTAGRPHFQPAPRLPRMVLPPLHLDVPPPMISKPPMVLPAASAASASGPPGNGQGGSGNGPGYGAREGNDYLIRLKAYIDAHKNRDRYGAPNDADLVLILNPDGVLTDIHVASSSGDPAVDDEIVAQLRRMSPFPKPPPILFSASKPLLAVADRWIFPR
jgi:periplasmic protein TonB